MTFKLKYRLKSGALQFTLFIGILIALILAGLILYAYTFIYLKEQSKAAIGNIQLSDTGIAYLLEDSSTDNDTITVPFIENEDQSIKGHLSYWGLFEKAYVESMHRKSRFYKSAIIGGKIDPDKSPTLYLQDNNNPLVVVGTTSISGITYLPSQGVRPGYIAGQSYYGTELIHGDILKSNASLPKIKQQLVDNLTFYLEHYKPVMEKDYLNTNSYRSAISFFKGTQSIYSRQPIVLENREAVGNIIIKSDTLIRVRRTALLKDLILIAPIVEIEDGVKGNFQVIASKKIVVGKEVKLEYPSALVLFQDNKDPSQFLNTAKFDNQIFIDAGSSVSGSVCYLQTIEIPDFETRILLETQAKIKGQVYCQGNFELKGIVSGSVYARQFIANQSGSRYINHIYNGIIENSIPEVFGGIVFDQDESKTVMKWLY